MHYELQMCVTWEAPTHARSLGCEANMRTRGTDLPPEARRAELLRRAAVGVEDHQIIVDLVWSGEGLISRPLRTTVCVGQSQVETTGWVGYLGREMCTLLAVQLSLVDQVGGAGALRKGTVVVLAMVNHCDAVLELARLCTGHAEHTSPASSRRVVAPCVNMEARDAQVQAMCTHLLAIDSSSSFSRQKLYK